MSEVEAELVSPQPRIQERFDQWVHVFRGSGLLIEVTNLSDRGAAGEMTLNVMEREDGWPYLGAKIIVNQDIDIVNRLIVLVHEVAHFYLYEHYQHEAFKALSLAAKEYQASFVADQVMLKLSPECRPASWHQLFWAWDTLRKSGEGAHRHQLNDGGEPVIARIIGLLPPT